MDSREQRIRLPWPSESGGKVSQLKATKERQREAMVLKTTSVEGGTVDQMDGRDESLSVVAALHKWEMGNLRQHSRRASLINGVALFDGATATANVLRQLL
ncbi:hypothetical protein V6N13_071512 [Hibiscus sabdariffa]